MFIMLSDGLENIRGLSEPQFFTFNTLDKGRKILCHAVLFTSFEIPTASESEMKLCSLESDPRMKAFVSFVWANYLKHKLKIWESEKSVASLNKVLSFLSERNFDETRDANKLIKISELMLKDEGFDAEEMVQILNEKENP